MGAAAAGLPAERFVSKRDGWLVAVLWIASLIDFGVAAAVVLGVEGAPRWVGVLLVAAGLFQLHVLYATDYAFDGDALHVRASLFRWRVPLAAIDSVEPTRNPLSSPACSLDRLRIRSGEQQVLISPIDQASFLRALVARATQLELSGTSARRRP